MIPLFPDLEDKHSARQERRCSAAICLPERVTEKADRNFPLLSGQKYVIKVKHIPAA